ncbi:MAG: hypothetical protein JWR40_5008 [Massilia sp.]|jgi:Flp pilus assembly protein TadG|nr:hypothetical protein [Massilia sp.]
MTGMKARRGAFFVNGHGRNQRGVAAIEFAVLLPVLVLVLALTLLFSRIFWHYTVAQKAAHDAAIMLANATVLEISTKKPDFTVIEIAKLAMNIAEEEVAELNPGGGRPYVEVFCDNGACLGDAIPAQVRVQVRINMVDSFFAGFTDTIVSRDGLVLRANVTMPYVGG